MMDLADFAGKIEWDGFDYLITDMRLTDIPDAAIRALVSEIRPKYLKIIELVEEINEQLEEDEE